MRVEDWDERTQGNLDLEIVRSLYQPVFRFRVQQHRYDSHTPFLSSGVARTYYVLSGQMHVSDGHLTYTIREKQYMSLPRGVYTITYPEAVEHICVLELPEQAWAIEKKLYETTFRPRLQKIDYRMS